MGEYPATVYRQRNGPVSADDRYSRVHTLEFDAGVSVPGSSSPRLSGARQRLIAFEPANCGALELELDVELELGSHPGPLRLPVDDRRLPGERIFL